MITVERKNVASKMTLGDLIDDNYKQQKNAYIGSCGNGPQDSLYIVGFDRIFLAEDPENTWDDPECSVYVDKFVRIRIIVEE